MHLVHRIVTAALALLVVCSQLSGCNRQKDDDRIVLGFSQIGEENDWRRANSESIRSAAATSNIDLRFVVSGGAQADQIATLRAFIAQKVDAIAFAPLVESGWDDVLKEARAAGIPVILTDRNVTSDPALYAGFLGSDFVEEGRKAGRWVAAEFKDAPAPVNIVELRGTPDSGPAIERQQGFAEAIASHPNLRIVRSEDADFSQETARDVMAQLLTTEKQPIHVLFAHSDDMALGAIKSLEAAGAKPGKDVKIVSIDAVRAAFEAMVAGKLNATIECTPLLGPQLMTSVTEVVAGRAIMKRTVVDEKVFTMDGAKQAIQSRKY